MVDLKITRTCPIDLEVDDDARQFYCDHCQKDVHVLANWRRAEAEAFMAANRGASMCISVLRDRDGELSFADSPGRASGLVPVSRLRRWLPEAAAAAGVAAVLSACTPHGPVVDPERPALDDAPPCAVPTVMVPDEQPRTEVAADASEEPAGVKRPRKHRRGRYVVERGRFD